MSKTVVIAFGRFNPPSIGHAALMDFMRNLASSRQADAVVFPSQSQDPKKNPLPFLEKVRFLKQFFGRAMNFNTDTRVRTPIDALVGLSEMGYENVILVVGSDRVADFSKLSAYIRPTGKPGGKCIILKNYQVVPIPGERDPDEEGIAGMSASKLRVAAATGDYAAFRAGVPTRNDALAKQLYQSVRRHMNVSEGRHLREERVPVRMEIRSSQNANPLTGLFSYTYTATYPSGTSFSEPVFAKDAEEAKARAETRVVDRNLRAVRNGTDYVFLWEGRQAMRVFFVYGTSPAAARPLCEALNIAGASRVIDLTGRHFADIRRLVETTKSAGHSVTLYTRDVETYLMTETWIRSHSTLGNIKQQFPQHVVDVLSNTSSDAKRAVAAHATRLMEAEEIKTPKQPSEVDRLKVQQKQQTLVMKQRQANDLLQAKERELENQSREDQEKIANGDKPRDITK